MWSQPGAACTSAETLPCEISFRTNITNARRQLVPSRSFSSVVNSETSGSALPSTAVIGTAPLRLLVQKAPRDWRSSCTEQRRIRAGVPRSSSRSNLAPRHPGQHLLVQRRRTPEAVLVLHEEVASGCFGDVVRPSPRVKKAVPA